MAKERNLQHALNIAAQIRSKHGDRETDPIADCPECGNNTFVLKGMSDDGSMEIGYCLHCGFERDYDKAQEDAFDAFIDRHEND